MSDEEQAFYDGGTGYGPIGFEEAKLNLKYKPELRTIRKFDGSEPRRNTMGKSDVSNSGFLEPEKVFVNESTNTNYYTPETTFSNSIKQPTNNVAVASDYETANDDADVSSQTISSTLDESNASLEDMLEIMHVSECKEMDALDESIAIEEDDPIVVSSDEDIIEIANPNDSHNTTSEFESESYNLPADSTNISTEFEKSQSFELHNNTLEMIDKLLNPDESCNAGDSQQISLHTSQEDELLTTKNYSVKEDVSLETADFYSPEKSIKSPSNIKSKLPKPERIISPRNNYDAKIPDATPFKAPSRIPRHTPRPLNSLYAYITSPVAHYIKNSPTAPICRNMTGGEITPAELSKLLQKKPTTKPLWPMANDDELVFPYVRYIPGQRDVAFVGRVIKLPDDIHALTVMPTILTRHEGRVPGEEEDEVAIARQLLAPDITVTDTAEAGVDTSLCTQRTVFID